MPNHYTNPRQYTATHLECIKCGAMLVFGAFHKDSSNKYGYAYYCKECACVRARHHHNKRKKEDPEYSKNKRRDYIKHRFSISLEEYEGILAAQNYECAICGVKLPASGYLTHLDHSHKTGKIRAFLCTNCNRGLGHFQDNPELLRKAALYLDAHTKNVDLGEEVIIL